MILSLKSSTDIYQFHDQSQGKRGLIFYSDCRRRLIYFYFKFCIFYSGVLFVEELCNFLQFFYWPSGTNDQLIEIKNRINFYLKMCLNLVIFTPLYTLSGFYAPPPQCFPSYYYYYLSHFPNFLYFQFYLF